MKFKAYLSIFFVNIFVLNSHAIAADLTLSGTQRVQDERAMTRSQVLAPGSTLLGIEAMTGDISQERISLLSDDRSDNGLQRFTRLNAKVAHGLGQRFQLSLLGSGTQDGSESRSSGQDEANKNAFKFAFGAVALGFQILDRAGFSMAIEPFLRVNGADKTTLSSYSRSSKMNPGAHLLFGYGANGVGSLDLGVSYRSLAQELVGSSKLLDEKSVDLGITARLSKAASLGAGVRHSFLNTLSDDEKPRHLTDRKAYARLGIFPGQIDIALFSSSAIDGSKQKELGLNVGYVLGRTDSEGKTSLSDSSSSRRKKENLGSMKDWKPQTGPNPNPDYVIPGIDPNERDIVGSAFLKPGEDHDDFRAIEASLKEQEVQRAKGPSHDELVEIELDRLREAERKVAEAKAKREAEEEALKRESDRAEAVKNAKKRAEFEEKANERARKMRGITADELNWRGLE